MNRNGFSPTDLNALQAQLASWRQGQPGRARLPKELWNAASTLARSQGVSWVARALRLDYYKLKRRCAETAGGISPVPSSPEFVEIALNPLISDQGRSWKIDLSDGAQGRMRIEISPDVRAVVALAEAFWQRQP